MKGSLLYHPMTQTADSFGCKVVILCTFISGQWLAIALKRSEIFEFQIQNGTISNLFFILLVEPKGKH